MQYYLQILLLSFICIYLVFFSKWSLWVNFCNYFLQTIRMSFRPHSYRTAQRSPAINECFSLTLLLLTGLWGDVNSHDLALQAHLPVITVLKSSCPQLTECQRLPVTAVLLLTVMWGFDSCFQGNFSNHFLQRLTINNCFTLISLSVLMGTYLRPVRWQ